MIDTKKLRKFFPAIEAVRIVSNNAASTQVPIQLLDLLKIIIVSYDNVNRGQSQSSILIAFSCKDKSPFEIAR